MPIPANFNEWENLQDVIKFHHNKLVKEYFKNQEDNNVETPKARLKYSCIIKDDDTSVITLLRMWLFEVTVGHAQALQTPIYGVPVQELQSNTKFKPQVKLYFKESFDEEIHGDGTPLAKSEITFRIMNETSETINRTRAESLARAIKNELAVPALVWEKGWYKYTYLDNEHGYDFRLLVKSKSEGERIVKKVLAIQNHSFNNDYFQYIDHERSYPINPGTHRVYGKTVKKFRQRPRADVKFRYAQLFIWGQTKPVNLVSVGGRFQSVIEKV